MRATVNRAAVIASFQVAHLSSTGVNNPVPACVPGPACVGKRRVDTRQPSREPTGFGVARGRCHATVGCRSKSKFAGRGPMDRVMDRVHSLPKGERRGACFRLRAAHPRCDASRPTEILVSKEFQYQRLSRSQQVLNNDHYSDQHDELQGVPNGNIGIMRRRGSIKKKLPDLNPAAFEMRKTALVSQWTVTRSLGQRRGVAIVRSVT